MIIISPYHWLLFREFQDLNLGVYIFSLFTVKYQLKKKINNCYIKVSTTRDTNGNILRRVNCVCLLSAETRNVQRKNFPISTVSVALAKIRSALPTALLSPTVANLGVIARSSRAKWDKYFGERNSRCPAIQSDTCGCEEWEMRKNLDQK